MDFIGLLKSVRNRRGPDGWKPPRTMISLDPGETAGWAIFEEGDYVDSGEAGPEHTMLEVYELITEVAPDVVVMEDYRIYGWKAKSHAWSDLFTPRLIGAIELTCILEDVPLYRQMAQSAKGFCTDKKLRGWGFYKTGKPHIRDAIRHGCYWLLFDQLQGGD